MRSFATFLMKDYTKDGYPIAMAGICPFGLTHSMKIELQNLMQNYSFPKTKDIFEIDYFMANYFSQKAPSYILAWGITLHIPGNPGPTGGIIGNPHIDINSADGSSEDIGNGLSVAAYPGGPGIVIAGNSAMAKKILNQVKPAQGGKTPLMLMAKNALDIYIPTAIMITDGTGPNIIGCAMAIEGNKVKYVCL